MNAKRTSVNAQSRIEYAPGRIGALVLMHSQVHDSGKGLTFEGCECTRMPEARMLAQSQRHDVVIHGITQRVRDACARIGGSELPYIVLTLGTDVDACDLKASLAHALSVCSRQASLIDLYR